jgi:hypothetical protein
MIHNNHRCYLQLTIFFLTVFLNFVFNKVQAQESFADKCLGKWEGVMHIYGKGQLRDSVPVQLFVEKTMLPNTWIWKTKYLSKTNPMEKNYKLILKDAATQAYVTDEGDGIELADYCFNNKLYGVFETHEVMLTSSYELLGNQLIFEVTSGKKMDEKKEVTNYSVLNIQRVIFKRIEE